MEVKIRIDTSGFTEIENRLAVAAARYLVQVANNDQYIEVNEEGGVFILDAPDGLDADKILTADAIKTKVAEFVAENEANQAIKEAQKDTDITTIITKLGISKEDFDTLKRLIKEED